MELCIVLPANYLGSYHRPFHVLKSLMGGGVSKMAQVGKALAAKFSNLSSVPRLT